MSSSSGSNLLGSVPPSLPLGFGMLGGLVPVSLPFQFPSLLNFNPTGPGVPGCSNMGASPATNSGYTLAQSECLHPQRSHAHVCCAFVHVYCVCLCLCNVARVFLSPPNLFFQFSFFLFLHITSCFGAAFLPSHLFLDCCALCPSFFPPVLLSPRSV